MEKGNVKNTKGRILGIFTLVIMFLQVILPTVVAAVETEEYIRIKKYELTAKEFISMYASTNGVDKEDCKLIQSGEIVLETDNVVTGMQLKVNEKTYIIVVRGDINCDGQLTATDLSQFKRHETGLEILQGARLKATDINYDGKTSMVDRSQLKMLLVGLPLPDDTENIGQNIVIKANTIAPARQVTIEVQWPENIEQYNKLISTDGGKTFKLYNGPITIEENSTIIARITDENEMAIVKETKYIVTNIDRIAPNPYEITAKTSTNSITVEGTTIDTAIDNNGDEITSGIAGIAKYMYKLDDGQWQEENTFTSLKVNTEYKIYGKAIDKAGNETEATNNGMTVKTKELPKASEYVTFEISQEAPSKDNVIIDFIIDDSIENMYTEYQIGGTEGQWIRANKYEAEQNGTIYVRLVDELGQTEGTKTIEITNIDKIAPNAFELTTNQTSNSITVIGETEDTASIGAEEGIAGISGYQYKIDDEEWTEKTTQNSYTFKGLIQGTNHTVSMRAIDNAGNITEATNANTSVLVDGNITHSINPATATRDSVTITLNTNTGYKIEYKIGEGDWTEYTNAIIVNENGNVYARIKDDTIEEKDEKVITITNIDKVAPNAFELTTNQTTNSITVNGETEDTASIGAEEGIAGISGYQFKLSDNEGNVITDWTEMQEETSYTFEGLIQGTTYKVSMKAIDNVGNETEATNKDYEVTVNEVADSETQIGIEYSIETATNGNVEITLTNNSEDNNLTLKYQINSTEGEWLPYEEAIEMTTNGTVYARLFDSTEQYNKTATATVSNIDKIAPESFELTAIATTDSITVNGATTDIASEGAIEGIAGISGYQFKLSDNEENVITDWTAKQEETSYTFEGLTQGTTYKVSMKAIDFAGNETEATPKEVTLEEIANSEEQIEITYSIETATNGNVLVTLTNNSEDENLTLKYQINSTEGEWLSYEEAIEMTTNGTVYARLFNNAGQYNKTATGNVNNIDKELPEEFNLTAIATTNSITVSGSTEDRESVGAAEGITGISGYQFKLIDNEGNIITDWTEIQEETSYTFEGLTQGTTYKVSMKAIDNAGNETEATNKDHEITVNEVADSTTQIGIEYSTESVTNGNVLVTLTNNSEDENLTIKYQINGTEGEWLPYEEAIEMTTNGTIYARLYDSTDQYNNIATANVRNIDKIAPEAFELTAIATTNNITVSGNTTDEADEGALENIVAGINGYQFKLSDNDGNVITDWTEIQEETSYTFEGLTQGTTYKVSMKSIDFAGNETEATNKDYEITVNEVADSETQIEIEYSTETLTNGNVEITLTSNSEDENLTLKYQINSTEGEWLPYERAIEMTTNGTVYARLFDSANQYNKTATANVTNIDKIAPEAFDLVAEVTTNSITISGSTEDTASVGAADGIAGISGYQFKLSDNEGNIITDWTEIQEETSYTFEGLTQGTTYKANMKAIDFAGNETEATETEVTVNEVANSEEQIEVEYSIETVTNGNVEVTLTNNSEDNNLTLKYQIDSTEGTWIEYEETIEMEANGTIYARLFDNKEQYNKTAIANVNNIDKELPEEFNLTAITTTNSITVSGSTEDRASEGIAEGITGISGYQFKLSDNEGNIITDWVQLQEGTSYTFEGLIKGTTYKVSMKAIDFAGNEIEATNKDKEVTLDEVANSETQIGIEYSKETATKSSVKITLTNNSGNSDLILKYQINSTEGEWLPYEDAVAMTANGVLYARLFDNTEQYNNTAVANVTNIDKIAPEAFDLVAEVTTNSITINGLTTDTASEGAAEDIAGVKYYQYRLDGRWTTSITENSYTFEGLEQGTEHTISMRAIDNAGNVKEVTNKDEIVILDIVAAGDENITYKLSAQNATKKDVTITLSTETEYTIEYKIGEDEENIWTEYAEEGITISENVAVYTRLKDNTNQTGSTKTINITNIDKVAPNEFEFTVRATSNSITVSGNTEDTASIGAAENIAGVKYYRYRIDGGSWTPNTTENSYTFEGLEQGSSHTVSMIVYDKAMNKTEATNNNKSVKVAIVPAGDKYIKHTVTPTEPTNGPVTVTLSTGVNYTIEYQIGKTDEDGWIEYDGTAISKYINGPIYARLKDSTDQIGSTKTINITNIDKIAPKVTLKIKTMSNEDKIDIEVKTEVIEEASEGAAEGVAGIAGYQYKIDEGDWSTITQESSHIFTGLTQETHILEVRVIDNAGNITERAGGVTFEEID